MWMKIDDGLHTHRKTRGVIKSHETKRRDSAPMGIWVLAGSWAAQNGTDGWVPEDELDRFDEEWESLVARLVRAGYWWPQVRDGEAGYGFNDWHDYNDPADLASKSGTYGNHVRWHINEKRVEPGCQHCPSEPPADDDIAPESGADSGAISGGDSRIPSPPIALPEPEPLPEPDPNPGQASSDKSDFALDRFGEWWETYGNKVGRKKCETAYRNALRKPGVTDDVLIATAAAYVIWCNNTGTFIKNPLTWLHGEHWRDERKSVQAPRTRVQEHLALVQQLADEEADPSRSTIPQIGGSR